MTRVWTEWKRFGSGEATETLFDSNGGDSAARSVSKTASAGNHPPPSVFISLPKNREVQHARAAGNEVRVAAGVYCEKPGMRKHRAPAKSSRSKIRVVSGMLPLVVLFATVFAAYGMLKMMMESGSIPVYYPAGYLKTQSWRGGAGPSPQDAVKSEYQNALTREMIAASDTGANAVPVNEKKAGKSKIDAKITLSASRYNASVKRGLQNLKFRVSNGTQNMLDKVTVEVDYLGKKGDLLKSETYTVTNVPPHKDKLLQIPEGTPCVKVQYRISEVRSKKHTTMLQHL